MSLESDKLLAEAFAHRLAGWLEEAIDTYRRAIEAGAVSAAVLSNLGEALNEALRSDEAIEPLRRAIEIDPHFAAAWSNLGVCHLRAGRLDDAIKMLERAVALDPENARLHLDLSLTLLTRGDWARGFDEFEWRWRCGELDGVEADFLRIPAWDGSPLRGRRILLHTEQGFGDSLLFVRYVPMVARAGGRVVLGCERELGRLFESVPNVEQLRVTGEKVPDVELRCSLASLPRIFETRPTRVPGEPPYLFAPFDAVARWKEKLADDRKLRVGVCWSGRMGYAAHRIRRIEPATLAALGAVENVTFYNLQKGASAEDQAATQLRLVDHTTELNDFADTAALMMNLDLIISADTSIPHLSGAIGAPTWTLLPFCADWRWMRSGESTPWFGHMRLFRQPKPGNWNDVIALVADSLAAMVGQHRRDR